MPLHDWTRVEAGIFRHFHQGWVTRIADLLNEEILPAEYYALAEQVAGGLGPDVVSLQGGPPRPGAAGVRTLPRPRPSAEIDRRLMRRRPGSRVAVRHVSGDRVIAVVEVVSPANKETRSGLRDFVNKADEFLQRGVHLLILDVFPPGPRDPEGIHAAIWQRVARLDYTAPPDGPRTFAAYEAGVERIRAYVEHVGVGQPLPDRPLFLAEDQCLNVPLERLYGATWRAMPFRWRDVVERA